MSANERQEGGNHYRTGPVQHWDFVLMHNMPYMEAQIFKYVLRWKDKNGVADLRKAKHFLEKLIEYELEVIKPAHPRVVDVCSGAVPAYDEANVYMNPDSGEPRGKGYVDQD